MQDKGKAHKPRKARKQKSAKTAAVATSPAEKKPQERVMEFLRTNQSKVCTPREVSQALGMKVHIAALMLGQLAANKSIEKVESGKYRAAA
jgi:predicted transcriptional regulator of viral defense system